MADILELRLDEALEFFGELTSIANVLHTFCDVGLGYLRLDRDLEAGMCVTIEPGLYLVPAILEHKELCAPFDADKSLNREALARFSDVRGIRIEDDVLCTESGPEVLTKDIPKTAEAVEAEVGRDVGN